MSATNVSNSTGASTPMVTTAQTALPIEELNARSSSPLLLSLDSILHTVQGVIEYDGKSIIISSPSIYIKIPVEGGFIFFKSNIGSSNTYYVDVEESLEFTAEYLESRKCMNDPEYSFDQEWWSRFENFVDLKLKVLTPTTLLRSKDDGDAAFPFTLEPAQKGHLCLFFNKSLAQVKIEVIEKDGRFQMMVVGRTNTKHTVDKTPQFLRIAVYYDSNTNHCVELDTKAQLYHYQLSSWYLAKEANIFGDAPDSNGLLRDIPVEWASLIRIAAPFHFDRIMQCYKPNHEDRLPSYRQLMRIRERIHPTVIRSQTPDSLPLITHPTFTALFGSEEFPDIASLFSCCHSEDIQTFHDCMDDFEYAKCACGIVIRVLPESVISCGKRISLFSQAVSDEAYMRQAYNRGIVRDLYPLITSSSFVAKERAFQSSLIEKFPSTLASLKEKFSGSVLDTRYLTPSPVTALNLFRMIDWYNPQRLEELTIKVWTEVIVKGSSGDATIFAPLSVEMCPPIDWPTIDAPGIHRHKLRASACMPKVACSSKYLLTPLNPPPNYRHSDERCCEEHMRTFIHVYNIQSSNLMFAPIRLQEPRVVIDASRPASTHTMTLQSASRAISIRKISVPETFVAGVQGSFDEIISALCPGSWGDFASSMTGGINEAPLPAVCLFVDPTAPWPSFFQETDVPEEDSTWRRGGGGVRPGIEGVEWSRAGAAASAGGGGSNSPGIEDDMWRVSLSSAGGGAGGSRGNTPGIERAVWQRTAAPATVPWSQTSSDGAPVPTLAQRLGGGSSGSSSSSSAALPSLQCSRAHACGDPECLAIHFPLAPCKEHRGGMGCKMFYHKNGCGLAHPNQASFWNAWSEQITPANALEATSLICPIVVLNGITYTKGLTPAGLAARPFLVLPASSAESGGSSAAAASVARPPRVPLSAAASDARPPRTPLPASGGSSAPQPADLQDELEILRLKIAILEKEKLLNGGAAPAVCKNHHTCGGAAEKSGLCSLCWKKKEKRQAALGRS